MNDLTNSARKAKRLYVDSEFGQLHLRYILSSPATNKMPLVCLHQSPKSSLEFATFIKYASLDRTVVAGDYPGYGMSDAPTYESEATIETYARNMWQIIDTLKLSKVDLLGHHTGAKVATEMTLQQPDRVGAIAMISASLLTEDETNKFREMFAPIPLDEHLTRIKVTWQRILERRQPGVSLQWLDRSLHQSMMGGEAYEWGHKAAFDYDIPFRKAVAELPHRKILLNLADDLQECTRRAKDIMRNGELIELPEWSYGFLDYHAQELCNLLLPRLDEYADK